MSPSQSRRPHASQVQKGLSPHPRIRNVIAVGSGKGGVGKSTTAVNLAVALAKLGARVGLLDADIYGPSVPAMLGLSGRPESPDNKSIEPMRAFGVETMSIGYLIEDETPMIWRGPMATSAMTQFFNDTLWDDLDYLLIDLPPGTGDIQLSMIQKQKPAGAVIVSTPQDLALMDATRAMDLFNQSGVPIIGLIENMAGYQCPHCGEVSDPFGTGGVQAAANVMGHDFLGRIPLTMGIRTASDAGQPPAAGDGPDAEAFHAIAGRIAEWLNQPAG